jgi:integrase/recombinase XerC
MEDLPILYAAHLSRNLRRSVHTMRAYRATAGRLLSFLRGHWGGGIARTDLAKVTPPDLRAFLAQRRAEALDRPSGARRASRGRV